MDISPFQIQYSENGNPQTAEVRPCCQENNVVDYAIWRDGKLEFTVTKHMGSDDDWVIALRNADDEVPIETVQSIGNEIAKHYDGITG